MKFILPYIIAGQPASRSFMEVNGFDTISAAVASAEEVLRKKYSALLKRNVCVAVAEIDFTYLDRETGKPLERPAPQPQPTHGFNRRRRHYYRR